MTSLLLACPMCFGDVNSTEVQAVKAGVLVLLGFIVPLLIAIAFIARTLCPGARALDRAAALQSAQPA
jgi:hypothetical protein